MKFAMFKFTFLTVTILLAGTSTNASGTTMQERTDMDMQQNPKTNHHVHIRRRLNSRVAEKGGHGSSKTMDLPDSSSFVPATGGTDSDNNDDRHNRKLPWYNGGELVWRTEIPSGAPSAAPSGAPSFSNGRRAPTAPNDGDEHNRKRKLDHRSKGGTVWTNEPTGAPTKAPSKA